MSGRQGGLPDHVPARSELERQIRGSGNAAGIHAPKLGPIGATQHAGGNGSDQEGAQTRHRIEYIPRGAGRADLRTDLRTKNGGWRSQITVDSAAVFGVGGCDGIGASHFNTVELQDGSLVVFNGA